MKLEECLKVIKKLFHEELGYQSSALLYGSAMTGHWSYSRSDIDIIIFLESQEYLKKFEHQLKLIQDRFHSDFLDGLLVYFDDEQLVSKRIFYFDREVKPLEENLLRPDNWMIKNQSRILFGNRPIKDFFNDVTSKELKEWAFENSHSYWIPYLKQSLSKINEPSVQKDFLLGPAIWASSGAARISTLFKTGRCMSKQDSLNWLMNQGGINKDLYWMMLQNYKKDDKSSPKLSKEQLVSILKECINLLEELGVRT